MPFVRLGDLTWPEAERIHKEHPEAVGVVPLAALEQHGHHLPLSTDMDIASAIAERVADKSARHLVVAPVLPGGVSTAHISFPGTVTLEPSVIDGYIDAYIDLFARMSIDSVVVFSAHGGNFPYIREAIPRLGAKHPSVALGGYSESEEFFALLLSTARAAGIDATTTDIHAGAIETSMALALFPERCRGEEIGEGGYSERVPFDAFVPVMYEQGVQALSSIGVLGDPRLASMRAGEMLVDAWVDELARWIDGIVGGGA